MTTTETAGSEPNVSATGVETNTLRNEPVQLRSAETLAKLEAAAIAMIAVHGREGFTTKHIADHAGVSVGTSYRYFVNRKAVLNWVYPNHVEGLGEPRKGAGQPFAPTEG